MSSPEFKSESSPKSGFEFIFQSSPRKSPLPSTKVCLKSNSSPHYNFKFNPRVQSGSSVISSFKFLFRISFCQEPISRFFGPLLEIFKESALKRNFNFDKCFFTLAL